MEIITGNTIYTSTGDVYCTLTSDGAEAMDWDFGSLLAFWRAGVDEAHCYVV